MYYSSITQYKVLSTLYIIYLLTAFYVFAYLKLDSFFYLLTKINLAICVYISAQIFTYYYLLTSATLCSATSLHLNMYVMK